MVMIGLSDRRISRKNNTSPNSYLANKKTLGKYQRYQNAAHRLNRDAYRKQAAKSKVKQFHPCEKYIVLIKADKVKSVSVIEQECIYTHCTCHPDLTLDELLEMEFTKW